MSQDDDEETLSDVNESHLSEMEKEKLEIGEIKDLEQCELFSGLGESNSDVGGGERDETVSLEDKPVGADCGEPVVSEKLEVVTVEMSEHAETEEATVAEEGAGVMIDDARSVDQSLEVKAEEEALEGAATAVTDTGYLRFEPQLGKEVEDELVPVIEEKVDVVVADLGNVQPLSELQTDASVDEPPAEREWTTEAEHDNTEKDTGNEEKIEVGQASDDFAATLVGEKGLIEAQHDNAEREMGEMEEVETKNDDSIETLVGEKDTKIAEHDNTDKDTGNEEKIEVGHSSDDFLATLVGEKGLIEAQYDKAERDMGEMEEVETKSDDSIETLVGKKDTKTAEHDNSDKDMGNEEKIDVGHASDDFVATLVGEKGLIEAQHDNAKREMGEMEEVETKIDDSIETLAGEKDTKTAVESEDIEDKVDATVKDSEVDDTETTPGSGGEKVDQLIAEGIASSEVEPQVEVITEVNANAVNAYKQEQIVILNNCIGDVSTDVKYEHSEDESITAEGTLMSVPKIMDDNIIGDFSKHPELDEPVSVAENNDAVVKEEHPAGDINMEMEVGAELELATNDVPELELDDGESEMETENQVVVDDSAKMETDETRSDLDEPGVEMDDTHDEEEETGTRDTEMETETGVTKSGQASATKRKRGKLLKSPSNSKPAAKSSSRKTIGEDVCFICFDGGDLFLCDRRGCPKAYHPSCVDRDESFFRAKGRWNCGWHMCSICEKTARYMCYTCTFSLCKSCIKDAVILCVRGNKGFCETCMRTVNLVENNEQGNKESETNFEDKSSWEYLFKDYYTELKSKLSLTYEEIAKAKNPWKGSDMSSGPKKQESSAAQVDTDEGGSASDDSTEKLKISKPKRRKLRKQSKPKNDVASLENATSPDKSDWASKELLEFVSHMKDGDTSLISQFDVQELLLAYIKSNKLRDPRRKSQIICDARLQNLFGKPRVGHFEMLKLLESHFFTRDEYNDDGHGSVVDTENNQLDIDDNGELTKGRKRKARRKSDIRQSNLDDYAAIDMHNISLIYLRRKLMEDLLEDDDESFCEKAVGTFVRLRIPGSNQKQDLYRLVQVVGTSKAPEPYKVGKKTTDIMVEILNLDKTEIIPIDTISNQEFTEEECKRLHQSIKCGLLSRLTVGEILDKAMEIQVARVNDWLESETLRLSHLRDRASDLGHRKELRECVEKLQLLKTPEERRRRLEEIPKVHADPKMDPSYESDENDSENEDSRRDAFMRSKGISRRGRGPISPGTDISQKESWSSTTRIQNQNREFSRNLSFSPASTHIDETVNKSSWNLGDRITQESSNLDKLNPASNSDPAERVVRTVSRSESFSVATPLTSDSPIKSVVAETVVKINESEKIWHYRDPSGKEQGPFSMVQLRKWNNTGYFPNDLKIWKNTDKESNSILLADALAGKFPKELPSLDRERTNTDVSSMAGNFSAVRNEITHLPSPTPRQSKPVGDGVIPSPTVVLPSAPASVLNPVQSYSPTKSQQAIQVGRADPIHHQSNVNTERHSVHMLGQTVISQNLQTETTQGWSGGAMVGQQQGYALSTPPPTAQNPSGTFSSPSTIALPQQDFWGPTQGGQPTIPTPTTPNASWGMKPLENNNSLGLRPSNPNIGRGPVQGNPNSGWGSWGPPPLQAPNPGSSSTTAGWAAPPGPVSGNMNPGWAPAQVWGPAPVQGPAWAPPGGNPGAPVSGNGWGPPGGGSRASPPVQGPTQSNPNQGWGPPPGNGGQFPGQAGGQGRDSGFSGGRPWNRGGGHSGGNFSKRDTVCPYNATGRCRKGAFCDYRHV